MKIRKKHIKSLRRARSVMTLALSTIVERDLREQMNADIKRVSEVIHNLELEIATPMFSQLQDTACPLSV